MIKIMPLDVLRNPQEISEICNSMDEPLYITKGGHGDLVIMSMATYEKDQAIVAKYRRMVAENPGGDAGSELAFEYLRSLQR